MSMLDGVSQCWWLAKDCRIWWEAWAAAFSGLAAVVAGVSAYAVFRLGRQANGLAMAAHDIAREERAAERESAKVRQTKEDLVVLSYCLAEIHAINPMVVALSTAMPQGSVGAIEIMGENKSVRDEFLKGCNQLETGRIESVLGRLGEVDPEVGMRLARLAGDCALIRAKAALMARGPAIPRPSQVAENKEWTYFTTSFRLTYVLLNRAVADSEYLQERGIQVTSTLGR